MTMNSTRIKRLVAFAAVVGAVAGTAAIASAAPLNPGDAATSGQSLSVTSGTNLTSSITLNLTGSNVCPGDTASNGYGWNTYIIPVAGDPAILRYDALGPRVSVAAPATNPYTLTRASTLYNTSGTALVDQTTGITSGLITPTAQFNFQTNAISDFPDGEYKLGYACVKAGQTEKYWQSNIIVANNNGSRFTWAVAPGAVPAKVGTVTISGVDNATFSGSFAAVLATPATTSYTVSYNDGTTTQTKNIGTATSFTLTSADGVENGKTYSVTVKATNSVGDGAASNAASTGLISPPAIAAPSVSTVGAAGKVTVNWVPATVPGGATLQSHTVTCTQGVTACPGSPFTVAAGTNTRDVTLAPGTYSFRVQAVYASPYVGAQSAAVSGSSGSAQLLIQNITIVRPAGALVLTQKCGVMGSAAAYIDPQMGNLPTIAATTGADPTGSPAVYAWDSNGLSTLPSGTGPTDPNRTDGKAADVNGPAYDGYPYPVDGSQVPNAVYTSNTNCAIDLGIGRLITNGPNAGQYFATTGRINQLSVVNTQDIDGGWTLNGKMSDFTSTSDANDTFSGNLLGWNPEVTWDSLANLDGYDMQVLAGDVRQPVASNSLAGLGPNGATNDATQADGIPASGGEAAAPNTLGTRANSLAKSTIGKSLGMAVIDARVRLLIPVTADAGTYTGTLTFTTI
jgi:hypothetical protein